MGKGQKVIISKDGERIADISNPAGSGITAQELSRAEIYAKNKMAEVKQNHFVKALGLRLNDDLVVIKEISPVKKSLLHIDHPLNDDETYKATYFEHPFKGEVIFVGKRKSRTLKVKPGDIVYYDSELRIRIFMFNNDEYMITSLSAMLGVVKYKESFLSKLIKRIRLNLFK